MKNNQFTVFLKLLEAIGFVLLTHFSYYVAFVIRYQNDYFPENIAAYIDSAPYMSLAILIIVAATGYLNMFKKSIAEALVMTLIVTFFISMATTFVAFFTRAFAFPRTIILLGYIFMFIVFSLYKVLVLEIIMHTRKSKRYSILTTRNVEPAFINRVYYANQKYDKLTHIVYEDADQLLDIIKDSDKVVIDENVSNANKDKVIQYCLDKKISVHVVPTLFEIAQVNASLTQMADLPLLKINHLQMTSERRLTKRIFDVVVSIIMLILTAPILLVAALLVKVYDGGPIFYTQQRLTEGRKKFNVIKLRTMVVNAEKSTGAVLSTLKDDRITPIGRFLRKHRIDEIPQFFNVLKGDMSIVGPRPERPEFVDQYIEEVNGFSYRNLVKAGITGLAQIMGDYQTRPQDKLKFDLIYLRSSSVLFDLKILFWTVKIVLLGIFISYDDYEIPSEQYLLQYNQKLSNKSYGFSIDNI